MKFARISSGADALPATASTRIKLGNLPRGNPFRSTQTSEVIPSGLDPDLAVHTERGNFEEEGRESAARGGMPDFFFESRGEVHMQVTGTQIPSKGDLVEQLRMGVSRVGVVWYADQIQVLVKWQDGKSSSLRRGRDQFSIRTAAAEEARSLNGSKPGDSPSAEGQPGGEQVAEVERRETDVGHMRRNRVHRARGAAV
ncbi:MAG: hypothetical protein V7645_2313 [Actinomycetota bacterium]